jgi:hypothetical protein
MKSNTKDGCAKHSVFDGSCNNCLKNRKHNLKKDTSESLSDARAVKNPKVSGGSGSMSDQDPRNLDDWAEMMVEAARIRAKENGGDES